MQKQLILNFVAIGSIIYGLVYWYKNKCNSIIKYKLESDKYSIKDKIKLFYPDYLGGKGAKKVLLKHNINNGRNETNIAYSNYVNLQKENNIIDNKTKN